MFLSFDIVRAPTVYSYITYACQLSEKMVLQFYIGFWMMFDKMLLEILVSQSSDFELTL